MWFLFKYKTGQQYLLRILLLVDGEHGGMRSQVFSSSIHLGIPLTFVAMQGSALAMASRMKTDVPSDREVVTKISAFR